MIFYCKNKLSVYLDEVSVMAVFGDLFNSFMGWLVVGIVVFLLVMMAYLFSMFINKSAKHGE